MRTDEDISDLKKIQSEPNQVLNFLTESERHSLLEYYKNSNEIDVKPTGPRCVYIDRDNPVLTTVLDKLKYLYGNFTVRNAQIFDTEVPHALHIDDGKDLPKTFKAFTIPLEVKGGLDIDAKLCFFDQYYYGGPAKFFKGETYEKKTYNSIVNDYTNIHGITDSQFPEKLREMFFNHLDIKWLHGLSMRSYFPWIVGSCIAFDALQIHCASDFRKAGINSKIGLSIFTTIE